MRSLSDQYECLIGMALTEGFSLLQHQSPQSSWHERVLLGSLPHTKCFV